MASNELLRLRQTNQGEKLLCPDDYAKDNSQIVGRSILDLDQHPRRVSVLQPIQGAAMGKMPDR